MTYQIEISAKAAKQRVKNDYFPYENIARFNEILKITKVDKDSLF